MRPDLHTFGSSGTPKGVAISHRNAVSFIEWASAAFDITADDQISSHAPFYFDLSIFDIYVSVKNGACIHLIDADLAMSTRHLATFISARGITVWYSAPAILGMLAEQHNGSNLAPNQLRLVLFAGEVFPITKLRALPRLWPEPLYYNLYGPTETNVCTAYCVPYIPTDCIAPLPIGHPCNHCDTIVVDEHMCPVLEGEPGLLCVAGPSLITNYWNAPEEIAQTIFYLNSKRWYNTGDRVSLSPEGYLFLGRLDRMIKRHGYRIELDEIESCLATHPALTAIAVVSTETDGNTTITAFLEARDAKVSQTDLKKFCYERLAHYMVPDYFRYVPNFPRTLTGKTNYQFLEAQCQSNLMNTDEHLIALHDDAVRFAREQLSSDIETTDSVFHRDSWQKCTEFGLISMAIPKDCGGMGAPLSDILAVMEGLGYGGADQGLLFSLNAHLWTVALPLAIHGTSEQRSSFLPGLINGSLIGANASKKAEAGSDVFSMRTQAVRDGDSYILNGLKTYITNAPAADFFVVYATIDSFLGPLGVTAFLVEATNPGICLGLPIKKMGLCTAQIGQITFKDCRIPSKAILGREGRGVKIFASAMEYECGCILAPVLGAIHRHIEACITHARTRCQFGQPIGKNQAIFHRIADMKVNLDAACELVYRVGRLKDAGKNATMEAACAKLFVSEMYIKFSMDALRIYGAQGYLAESPVWRGLRDSIASIIYSGTCDIQCNIIATELGL